jgi:hypothetical protein
MEQDHNHKQKLLTFSLSLPTSELLPREFATPSMMALSPGIALGATPSPGSSDHEITDPDPSLPPPPPHTISLIRNLLHEQIGELDFFLSSSWPTTTDMDAAAPLPTTFSTVS